jgi:hypothetical protein
MWLEHIHGVEVRQRHAALLERALRTRPPGPRHLTHIGESNTPTRAALLSTRFEPVLTHGHEPLGVAIVHSVVRDRPIEEVYEIIDRPIHAYRGADAQVTQCSCCRRLRDPADPERWDFVPALVAAAVPVAHALCELCGELHYGPPFGIRSP